MNWLFWLISKIAQFVFGRSSKAPERAETDSGRQPEFVISKHGSGNFDDDYRAAIMILKTRMVGRFPDNYYAKPEVGPSGPRDHGEDRAAAIDTMSAAVASALRKGATVQQAIAAGAASIGI
jgi:hypothetical protein